MLNLSGSARGVLLAFLIGLSLVYFTKRSKPTEEIPPITVVESERHAAQDESISDNLNHDIFESQKSPAVSTEARPANSTLEVKKTVSMQDWRDSTEGFSVPNKSTRRVPTYDCSRLYEVQGSEPSFLVVGVHKGGSTALYNYLCEHGQVVAAVCKEVHFFDRQFMRGKEFYLRHFPQLSEWKGKAITGEGSPAYIRDPKVAFLIKELYPNIKFLLTLREPTMRLRSQWLEQRRLPRGQRNPFGGLNCEGYWRASLQVIAQCISSQTIHKCFGENYDNAIMQGLYYPQIVAWLSHFPPEQTMVIQSEMMFDNPEATMQRVAQFLGLRIFIKSEVERFESANVGTKHHDMPELAECDVVLKEMEEFYAPYNKQLWDLLAKRFDSAIRYWDKTKWPGL